MGYGGESNAKRQARCVFWSDTLETQEFRERHLHNLGRFLVLCGPDRGDVKYLDARLTKLKYKSKFEDDEMIIAVDESMETLETALERSDDTDRPTRVIYKHANALDIAKEYRHEFSVIYLDLCNNISPQVLEEAATTASIGLRDHGIFAMTLMCGREKNGIYETIQEGAAKSRYSMFDKFAGRYLTTESSLNWLSQAAFIRTQYIWEEMNKNLDRLCRGVLLPRGLMTYSSRKLREDRTAAGVPMLVLWWAYRRSHKPMGRRQHDSWAQKAREKDFGDTGTRLIVEHLEPDVDGSRLRLFALQLRDQGHDTDTIGRILNLPPRRLSAWFAWDTMNKRKKTA